MDWFHAEAPKDRWPRFLRALTAGLAALTIAAALGAAQTANAASPLPSPMQKGVMTNRLAAPPRPAVRTNTAAGVRPGGSITNAAGKSSATNAVAKLTGTFRRFQTSPAFYPAVGGVAALLVALLLLRLFGSGKAGAKAETSKAVSKAARPVPVKAATVHGCNILEIGAQAQQVWQFDVRGQRYVLNREHTVLEGESLPGYVRKDWRSLFQRKLNVALLPPEHVFLRALQLPRGEFSETLSMVELQLEKLSPMPVAQIVWSLHVLPHAEDNMQTVVVMIVARSMVEEFLGKLEAQGYLADRLELPIVDQLQTTAITEDGAWIYPEVGGSKSMALVAWWYGGVLQNLDLLSVPPGGDVAGLKEQLTQMAWAGEMEGWLTSPPDWHLVADAVVAAEWEPVLRSSLEQSIEVVTPLASREVAALTARRAATTDPRANLMPLEYATRYQQQFVDRLWMRGLLAVAGLYVVYVLIYMARLGVANYSTGRVEAEMRQLSPIYTNAMQLKARYQVLKDRQELKYAALDCWNAAAQNLPENATLDSLSFSQGKKLSLNGTAPPDNFTQMNDFAAAMQKSTVNGQLLFEPTKGLDNWRAVGANLAQWSLGFDLKRSEVQ